MAPFRKAAYPSFPRPAGERRPWLSRQPSAVLFSSGVFALKGEIMTRTFRWAALTLLLANFGVLGCSTSPPPPDAKPGEMNMQIPKGVPGGAPGAPKTFGAPGAPKTLPRR